MNTYPLAKEDVFLTRQGEGTLLGLPMVFIRLAGCSVGCPQCDTDYGVSHRMTAREIANKAAEISSGVEWCWITGGEPTDHPLGELISELRRARFRIALATAGVATTTRDGWVVHCGSATDGIDFISVSPHSWESMKLRTGTQCNVVPGLNGLEMNETTAKHCDEFTIKWATPMSGNAESLRACIEWCKTHYDWRLGIQAHKQWGIS